MPGSSPLTVAQVGGPVGGGGIVGGDEIVVPDGFLGHSVRPVVVLTQSMTSRRVKFCCCLASPYFQTHW